MYTKSEHFSSITSIQLPGPCHQHLSLKFWSNLLISVYALTPVLVFCCRSNKYSIKTQHLKKNADCNLTVPQQSGKQAWLAFWSGTSKVQRVDRAAFLSGGSGDEPAFKRIHVVVGRTELHVDVGNTGRLSWERHAGGGWRRGGAGGLRGQGWLPPSLRETRSPLGIATRTLHTACTVCVSFKERVSNINGVTAHLPCKCRLAVGEACVHLCDFCRRPFPCWTVSFHRADGCARCSPLYPPCHSAGHRGSSQ